MGGKGAALSLSLKARHGAKAPTGHRISRPCGPDNRLCRVCSCPWNKMVTGTGRRSGLRPSLLVSRALRWPRRDRKDAGNFGARRFRRCTGRLNATQPGVLTVSSFYIRGIGLGCKERRGRATPRLIRLPKLKGRLTLWFYASKRLLGGTNRWRAAQIILFCLDRRYCAPQHSCVPGIRRLGGGR